MKIRENVDRKFDDTNPSESQPISNMAEIVAKLITRRKELNMIQNDLSEKTGLKQSAISRIESMTETNPKIDTIAKMAYGLGLKLTLIDIEEKNHED